MTVKTWEVIRVRYCEHAGSEVGLEAEVVYPADILPDQPPRVKAHRCSHAFACNLDNRPSCIWAGTNPTYDPFLEAQDFVKAVRSYTLEEQLPSSLFSRVDAREPSPQG